MRRRADASARNAHALPREIDGAKKEAGFPPPLQVLQCSDATRLRNRDRRAGVVVPVLDERRRITRTRGRREQRVPVVGRAAVVELEAEIAGGVAALVPVSY